MQRVTIAETGKRPQRNRPGRICRATGCATRLSVYNPAEFCSLHEADASPAFKRDWRTRLQR
jgi:hypothetical protein